MARKKRQRPAKQIEFSVFGKLHKGSPVSSWADPKTATPLQNFKAIQQLGQRKDRAARHRARNRPSDN